MGHSPHRRRLAAGDESAFVGGMRKHVLLVAEDDATDAMLLERAIQRTSAAFEMVRVENGDDAIAYLRGTGIYSDRLRHPVPHLMLLDLKMPHRDGFAVLRWRQGFADANTLPVVVFSSSDLPEDIERAYSLGANSFVTKPAGCSRLERMVKALSDWWAGHNLAVQKLA